MKKIYCAIAVILTAVTVADIASAADIAKAPLYKAPPVLPAYNWTGFYVGGNIGGAWSTGDSRWDPLPDPAHFGINTINQSLKDSSIAGGAQLGYNYQFLPSWVAGIEADWIWTGNKASETTLWTFFGTTDSVNSYTNMSRKIDWLSTVRGRIGYTITPQTLLYTTGGFAFGHIKYDAIANNLIGYAPETSLSKTKTGYALGGGLEWAVTNNWLLRGEYLFYHFSGESTVVTSTYNTDFPSGFSWNDTNIHSVRAALSYKFGN